jgi:acyl-CoA thioester hydrolase
MIHRFVRPFRVRHYELDASGHLQGVNLVRYMQEAAIEASTDLGFSPDWYRQQGTGWVVRRLFVHYDFPATYGDEIEVATWLSIMRGVRSLREYDVTLKASGRRVARGRAEWVYMDFQTGQPSRVPDAWIEALTLSDKPEDLGIRLSNPRPIGDAHRYIHRRRVQFHELDAVEHVNHAVYLQWIEQASREALRSVGCQATIVGHEIQYFAAAVDQEDIEVASWLCEANEMGSAWTHEIYHGETRKLLARDYAHMEIRGTESDSVLEKLRRGPNP